ncbi:MAG: UDP-N-acetylmuramoyl-L-alanyl-D-glutamate--2,6-diaminopimelate ligase [Nitrospirae bacterium]|nr:UDP-N-acetylmuramoyl-L-alanyl-D-glutamate--2,6-diaminopimelate ligase [Nitrospirota bacterium]
MKDIKARRISGDLNREVKGIAYDSRLIKNDYLFAAIKGFSTDGHIYIENAISRGAVAVVAEESVNFYGSAAFIEVDDSRQALAVLSAAFYKNPSSNLSLIGITGTNGKTTTSYITKSILDAWGKRVGLLGTIRYITGDRVIKAIHTTPESLDLQMYLREMLDSHAEYAVLEVSSHALALKRVEGCSFKVGVFTNFTQDHLDFHGTMDGYFSAKTKLFDYVEDGGYAVLNRDDPSLRGLAERLKCNVITCGLEEGAMIRAVYNILMSIGVAYALGVTSDAIIKGIREVKPVEGRFEKIDEGQRFLCILDYAHTEDALKRLIQEARLTTKGKIITVFGCGGDRDRGKRPKMGAVATELSDVVIITSDNPRSEDPLQIINEIIKGVSKDNYTVLPERAEAINKAVSVAEEGDTVLLAGKGHEDYQEIIKGVRHPFSDREAFRKAVNSKQ